MDDNVATTSEGADCSGFVSTAWYMGTSWQSSGAFEFWSPLVYQHPVTRLSSKSMWDVDSNGTWKSVSFGNRNFMDAAVLYNTSTQHIELIIVPSSDGTADVVLHQRSPAGVQETKNVVSQPWKFRNRTNW
ncbi:MAG: hypothetical protein F2681_04935 [Actinobacteria bacterium]|nr:hypothetical protein [Actinomycetota bacterium]MSW76581.1 hypothetical protein [Actinomycetota bacterium]MSX56124.1 hypothetical protein [Actinomycetota bacterium]MSX93320.1 hypothetical protein [Actinomycetota bacterium]MSZ82469.1 hypothetical protein [Actinomycetota bacterium]